MTLLPTPRTNDMRGPGVRGDGGLDLRTAISLMPTPAAARSGRQRSASAGAAIRPSLDSIGKLLPTPRATDGTKGGPNQRGSSGDLMLPSAVVQLLPTPTAKCAEDSQTHRSGARSDELLLTGVAKAWAVGALLPTPMAADGGSDRASSAGFGLRDTSRKIPDQWGPYAPAVGRWEAVTGRQAPSPTEPGAKGQPRLSPPFVEWLMGLPAGWVTEHLGRSPALKCLGNGVVWQQAAHAYAELLACATSNEVAQGV